MKKAEINCPFPVFMETQESVSTFLMPKPNPKAEVPAEDVTGRQEPAAPAWEGRLSKGDILKAPYS